MHHLCALFRRRRRRRRWVLPLQCNVIFTTSRDSVKQPPTHPRSQWFWRSDRVSSVCLSVVYVCMYVCMGKQLYFTMFRPTCVPVPVYLYLCTCTCVCVFFENRAPARSRQSAATGDAGIGSNLVRPVPRSALGIVIFVRLSSLVRPCVRVRVSVCFDRYDGASCTR